MIEIAPKRFELLTRRYADAQLYCFSLNIDGKVGWRLPTRKELDSIYSSNNNFSIVTAEAFTAFYASSDICEVGTYFKSFRDGSGSYFKHPWLFGFLVRPVRDLKDN